MRSEASFFLSASDMPFLTFVAEGLRGIFHIALIRLLHSARRAGIAVGVFHVGVFDLIRSFGHIFKVFDVVHRLGDLLRRIHLVFLLLEVPFLLIEPGIRFKGAHVAFAQVGESFLKRLQFLLGGGVFRDFFLFEFGEEFVELLAFFDDFDIAMLRRCRGSR